MESEKILGNNYKEANMDNIADVIVDIITKANSEESLVTDNTSDGISW